MHSERCFFIFIFCISLRGLLGELLEDPPPTALQNVRDHPIKMCPCILETHLCTDSFNVPLILTPRDTDWYAINSQNLSLIDGKLPCPLGLVRTKIREGSFALLPNSSIVHIHSGLIFDTAMYCFDKSYNDDFAPHLNGRAFSKLDATVCIEPPVLPLCCHEGEIMSERNGSSVCDKSTRYTPPLNPKVVFDGGFHDWSSQGVYQSFPECNESLTFMPIQNNQFQRSLEVVDRGVRFLWETGELGKVSISQRDFCVGQITSYSSLSPAVAFCRGAYTLDKLCTNRTCFSKCCSSEYVFDLSTLSCEMDSFYYTWSPPNVTNTFTMLYGMPSCSSYFPLSALDPSDEYALLDNGSLWIASHSSVVPPSQYCIDYFRNYTHMIEAVLVCFQDSEAQEAPLDISAMVYFICLLLSSLQMLVVTGIFLYRVYKTKKSVSRIGHFHILVCEMMIFSALQLLFIALQQAFSLSLPTAACTFLVAAAEVAELAAVGDVCFFCVQYNVDVAQRDPNSARKPRWILMSFHVIPFLVSVLVVAVTLALLTPPSPDCVLGAAMLDPWKGYPVTCTTGLLILISTILLFKDFKCQQGLTQATEQNENSNAEQSVQYRWWLCAKMVFIHTMYWVSYSAVWMSDGVAFWVFADIALVLKALLVSCSLLRHHAKHHREQTSKQNTLVSARNN